MNFNIINQAMQYLLNTLHNYVGSYGLAIVLLTVAIRLILWPLNSSQTKSMRKMQELQPKLKLLQARYKDEPQKMQEAMMKFYAENKFNPMAGCLPMIIQIPIFLGLYGALSSPSFLAGTVNENFLFIKNLSHTMQSHAGKPLDGTFDVQGGDTFNSDRTIKLVMTDGKTLIQDVAKQNELLQVSPKPLMPGSPMRVTLNLAAIPLSDDYRTKITSADVLMIDNKSRELENVQLSNTDGVIGKDVQTAVGKDRFNIDVLILVLLYGLMTLGYQKVMSAWAPKPNADDPTAAMQANSMKFMPLIFVAMMFFIPIPAGALIYLVVTTAMMIIQTWLVNVGIDKEKEATSVPSEQVIDIRPN